MSYMVSIRIVDERSSPCAKMRQKDTPGTVTISAPVRKGLPCTARPQHNVLQDTRLRKPNSSSVREALPVGQRFVMRMQTASWELLGERVCPMY